MKGSGLWAHKIEDVMQYNSIHRRCYDDMVRLYYNFVAVLRTRNTNSALCRYVAICNGNGTVLEVSCLQILLVI